MNRIRIALFNDRAAAELIVHRLRLAGIPAEIHDVRWPARLWFASALSGGVRVEVPASLCEVANQLLLAWDAEEGILESAITCPECNSLQVDYPQFTHDFIFPNLVIGPVAGLGLLEKDYYCEACHYMWPKPTAEPPRTHAHWASHDLKSTGDPSAEVGGEHWPWRPIQVDAKIPPAAQEAACRFRSPRLGLVSRCIRLCRGQGWLRQRRVPSRLGLGSVGTSSNRATRTRR